MLSPITEQYHEYLDSHECDCDQACENKIFELLTDSPAVILQHMEVNAELETGSVHVDGVCETFANGIT